MRTSIGIVPVIVALLALTACGPDDVVELPKPVNLNQEASGYFCNMTILDHPGPKAQAFVKGSDAPFWFTSARDAIAFSILPESANAVAVMYVTDMATVESWENTAKGNWIKAEAAFYVIESSKRGGMGAAEAVPFGTMKSATGFQGEFGGKVVKYADVPRSYVLDANQVSSLEDK